MSNFSSLASYIVPLAAAFEVEAVAIPDESDFAKSGTSAHHQQAGDAESEQERRQREFRAVYEKEKVRLTYLYRPPFEAPDGCAERLSTLR